MGLAGGMGGGSPIYEGTIGRQGKGEKRVITPSGGG